MLLVFPNAKIYMLLRERERERREREYEKHCTCIHIILIFYYRYVGPKDSITISVWNHKKIHKKQGAGFLGCVQIKSNAIQQLKDTGCKYFSTHSLRVFSVLWCEVKTDNWDLSDRTPPFYDSLAYYCRRWRIALLHTAHDCVLNGNCLLLCSNWWKSLRYSCIILVNRMEFSVKISIFNDEK